jgi:inosine-uridine nucleoside N-ribohydrolase
MEASYQEILTVLDKMGVKDQFPVYRGSSEVMTSPDEPVQSEAAEKIIELALQERKQPLYVVAIGAITNVTSAILMEPKIKEHIIVEWLGGHPPYWEHAREFNLVNDPIAAMALFDSGVPLVWVPCKNVAEHLRTVPVEMDQYVRGRGPIGDYLADLVKNYIPGEARSKVLWDIANLAYLLNPEWVPTKLLPTPKLNVDNLVWEETESKRHLCRTAIHLYRDPILLDFFQKLDKFAKGEITV